MEAKRQAILVAGMHRSGTSVITRLFNLLGASLSENLLPASRGNELGHWESAEAVELHERMLRSAGSKWDSVFGIEPSWFQSPEAAELSDALAGFVRSDFDNAPIFAVKDPRLALFIPVWQRALGELGIEPRFVLPFRHPLEVAWSLATRQAHFEPDGMWPTGRGTLLWLRYVLAAERATRGQPRSFVRFDALLSDWQGEVERMSRQLGLTWPDRSAEANAEVDRFLDRERKHENVSAREDDASARISPWLDRVLDQLTACVDDPEAGRDVFDAAGQALGDATALFGDYVAAQDARLGSTITAANRELEEELERQKALVVQMEAEQRVNAAIIRELQSGNEALTIALSQETQASAARDRQIEALLTSTSWRITAPIRKLKSLYQ